jgi:hypothetical protein
MFLLTFFIIGCGSEGASSSVESLLSIETQKSEVNSLKNKMDMDFLVKSDYGSNVEVILSDLSLTLPLCLIENVNFTPSKITLDENKIEENIHATVTFKEECVPDSFSINGKSFLTLNSKSNEVPFESANIEITPTIESNTTTVIIPSDTNSTPVVVNDVTLPIVVIPNSLKNIKLTTNNKNIEIAIKVFKDVVPYSVGNVRVELPTKVLKGVDVGLFDAYEVPVNEQGIATFNYTGPSNLQGLIDSNDLSSTFKFYHTENSANKQELMVNYEIDEEIYTPVNYFLTVATKDSDFSMGIPNLEKTFSILIKNSKEDIVTDINITKIEVESQNTLVAKLLNTETKLLENRVELQKENNSNFILVSKKLSGLVPLKVFVEFIGSNNQKKTLSTVINIRVMSGPPSAISVSYLSSGQDVGRAKYEEKFAVSVTDEYGNRVNTQPYISLGAIVGYSVDGSAPSANETSNTKRLYYGQSDVANAISNGLIDALDDEKVDTTQFEDTLRPNVFKWIKSDGKNSDKLVVFGKGKNYEAMGKWDFNKIDNNTLKLEDDYFGINRDELFYAVGHNYYQDQCQDDGREWIGNTDSEKYQLDEEGTVIVSYKYDYQLMGKDAMVWVNLNGYQSDTAKDTRIGEVTRHTLLGKGIHSVPEAGYSLDKNTTASVTFEMWHNATNRRYRNAHFSWREKADNSCQVLSIHSSNRYDARTCKNGFSSEGASYLTLLLRSEEDKGCSFNIDELYIADEF